MVNCNRRHILQAGLAGLVGAAALKVRPGWAAGDDGTLRIALAKQVSDINPHRYVGLWNVQSMVFDPLVRYGQGGVLEPALAQSWSVSDDGRVITFHLRPGVTFSDGTPWDAQALQWNFDRWTKDS